MHYNTSLYFTKSFITDLKKKKKTTPTHRSLIWQETLTRARHFQSTTRKLAGCQLTTFLSPSLKPLFDASPWAGGLRSCWRHHWEADQAISSILFTGMGIWLKSGWGIAHGINRFKNKKKKWPQRASTQGCFRFNVNLHEAEVNPLL